MNLILAVNGLQVDFDVWITGVRKPPGIVVLVHRVAKEHRVTLCVASRALDLHVVKLRRAAIAKAACLLHLTDGILLLGPRPGWIDLTKKVDEKLTLFNRLVAHDAKSFSVHVIIF